MEYEVLPIGLTRSPTFKADVEALLEASTDQLMEVKKVLGRERDVDESMLNRAQEILGIRREAASRIFATLGYLLGRISSGEFAVTQLVGELQKLTGKTFEDGEAKSLEQLFSISEDDLQFEQSSTAFSFGDTLIGASFYPVFSFGVGEQASTLFPGIAWSINFRKGSRAELETITLNASALEIRDLAKRMIRAAEDAEAKLAAVIGAKK
jgi:hypothetical protein